MDDEILKDFLVEAREILEQLSEQLVQLEQRPDDKDLLNAVFRGFHTVKGGAGFLGIDPLIAVCHSAENVFDLLRNDSLDLSPELMDLVLGALDATVYMFHALEGGIEPQPASPELLARLDAIAAGQPLVAEPSVRPAPTQPDPEPPVADGADVMSDDEFEALLDELHGPGAPGVDDPDDADGDLGDLTGFGAESAGGPTVRPETPAPAAGEPVEDKPSRGASVTESSVRVDTQRLDDIMNMVGELVLARNRLVRIAEQTGGEDLARTVQTLDLVTTDLQMSVMKTRMQPVRKVFGRFPRLVRDVARQLGKSVSLDLRGEDTDLDKTLVDALADPLVHLVRNAVDHGIETPTERRAAGKPENGHIELAAEQEGDHILLTIRDDGAGIDPDALRKRAIDKGILDAEAAQRLPDDDALLLIFEPGFSTKAEVSDVSGRGVGMDVVKTQITDLSGSVDVVSEVGEGTEIRIKVPLTLAIMPTLMVRLDAQVFALPLVSVVEIFRIDLDATHVVDGREVVMFRGKPLPVYYLKRWLKPDSRTEDPVEGHVIVISTGTQRVGFLVDELIGQEEVVIKPLGEMLHGTPGMAGATITGDGSIALIVDVPGMLRQYAS